MIVICVLCVNKRVSDRERNRTNAVQGYRPYMIVICVLCVNKRVSDRERNRTNAVQ